MTTITQNFPADRRMNLLIGTLQEEALVFGVPHYNQMKTEIDHINSMYGGVFAMNLTHFIGTHECIPLFESPASLIDRAKTARILILIPNLTCQIRRMYETRFADLPLFMFSQDLYQRFVKATLILEYST